MIRNLWRVVLSCLLVLTVSLGAATRRTSLTILHTNDTHSTLFPFGPLDDWGGIARMSEKIKELRSKSENVLVLNAGDVFVGTFEFNKYLGYPELKIMEGLYDAMCLGNHEFDLGPTRCWACSAARSAEVSRSACPCSARTWTSRACPRSRASSSRTSSRRSAASRSDSSAC